MKKPILLAAAFVAADQAVKLIIRLLAMGVRQTLIPGVLEFHPVVNTNLNWVSSMAGITPPVWLMVLMQLVMLALVVLLYRYLAFCAHDGHGWLVLFFAFASAGVCCSFIDVVFWGGSLDFLGLFDWFVFDTKDVFLNASYISIAIWEIRRTKTPGEDGSHKGRLRQWFRLGCPVKPVV